MSKANLAIGLVFTILAAPLCADIPPPVITGDADNQRIADGIDQLRKGERVPVAVEYSRTATRIEMVVPKPFVARVEKCGLLEYEPQAAPASDASIRNMIVGLALSAGFIAAGALLIGRIGHTLVRVALAGGTLLCVVAVLTLAFLWSSVIGTLLPGNEPADGGPRKTKLGVYVTVVETGDQVKLSAPEHLRPPPRRDPRDRWPKDKDK